jgi:hypothetical protein
MGKLLKNLFLGLGGLLIALIAWGLIEPYFLDQEEEVAVIPGLPSEWEGQRIAQLSDFQVGMWLDNEPTIRQAVEATVEAQPAAVLISGDFVYHSLPNPQVELDRVTDLLRPLIDANIPTYAVLGNHDYSHQPVNQELANQVETALEELGVVVLQNEAVPLSLNAALDAPSPASAETSDALYLVGLGSHIANNDQIQAALTGIPADSPRIAMMHNPKTFKEMPANTAPVAVAGHTHGGQMRLPFLPQWTWINLTRPGNIYGDGWITERGENGNELYVNRGIGFSDLPLRINCAPEVTLFTLRSQSPNAQSADAPSASAPSK